jgi:hypothetical protein
VCGWKVLTHRGDSGNLHSGLFMAGGWNIYSNRIGLKAHADEPLPNGASGIFLSALVNRAIIASNVIAFNREMGIAIDPACLYVQINQNAIWKNGGLAIDDGLDGPSAAVKTDTTPLDVPVVTSAVYDPGSNQTTIRGTQAPFSVHVEVFASDAPGPGGAGEAQRFLGIGGGAGDGFVLTVNGDRREQWVAATVSLAARLQPAADIYTVFRTSELSRAVQVR